MSRSAIAKFERELKRLVEITAQAQVAIDNCDGTSFRGLGKEALVSLGKLRDGRVHLTDDRYLKLGRKYVVVLFAVAMVFPIRASMDKGMVVFDQTSPAFEAEYYDLEGLLSIGKGVWLKHGVSAKEVNEYVRNILARHIVDLSQAGKRFKWGSIVALRPFGRITQLEDLQRMAGDFEFGLTVVYSGLGSQPLVLAYKGEVENHVLFRLKRFAYSVGHSHCVDPDAMSASRVDVESAEEWAKENISSFIVGFFQDWRIQAGVYDRDRRDFDYEYKDGKRTRSMLEKVMLLSPSASSPTAYRE